jgi:hypothetical protein
MVRIALPNTFAAATRECLAAWELYGRIDPFPLGEHDRSDRLLIPEKLYGREREIDGLIAVFDRVVARDSTELVFVSGYSGIGKSSLVNELHSALVPSRGLFAAGKFDSRTATAPATSSAAYACSSKRCRHVIVSWTSTRRSSK